MGDADILTCIHGVGKGRSHNLLEWLERNLPHQASVFARKFGVPVDGTVVPQLVKPRGGDDGCMASENDEAEVKQEWSQKLHGDNTLLHVSGLSPIAAFHQPRMREVLAACNLVLKGKGFDKDRSCIIVVPSKPRPIAGQVGEESVLKIGYAHPGGNAGNAVIAFATVLCAAVATVLSDSVSNAALDHLRALDSFCKFPVVFREPPVMTLDAAWDMMEEGFDPFFHHVPCCI